MCAKFVRECFADFFHGQNLEKINDYFFHVKIILFVYKLLLLLLLLFLFTDNTTNRVYIMMEVRLEALFKKPEEYTILERFVTIYFFKSLSCNVQTVCGFKIIPVDQGTVCLILNCMSKVLKCKEALGSAW